MTDAAAHSPALGVPSTRADAVAGRTPTLLVNAGATQHWRRLQAARAYAAAQALVKGQARLAPGGR